MSIKRSFKMDAESGEYTESSSTGGKKTKTDATSTASGDSKEPVQEVRVLIENHQVGGIIGKVGANVRKVREDSKAFVSILKAEFRNVQERIMVLKGTVPQIAKATALIAHLMLDASKGREKKGGSGGGSGGSGSGTGSGSGSGGSGELTGDPQAQFRFLVHKSAVGAIIGKGGATIKETQVETQTRIQVSNEPLPQSTEKSVTITGTPINIEAASLRVLNQLKDNPLRSGTKSYPYVPGQPVYPSYGLPAGGGYGSPPPPLYGAVTSPVVPLYGYGSQPSPTSTQKNCYSNNLRWLYHWKRWFSDS